MALSTVAILGTGWLGLPLVEALAAEGLNLRGSYRRTTEPGAIRAAGGVPYRIELPCGPDVLTPFLRGADVLVITLPPGGRRLGERAPADYLQKLRCLSHFLDQVRVVFTSSIGIYGDRTCAPPPVPVTASGRAVLAAEEFLAQHCPRLTVLRLAGLYGPGRDPANFFRNRATITRADAPVNLLHREDAIAAIRHVILAGIEGTYNVCAAAHPTKKEFYGKRLGRVGLFDKRWVAGGADGKRVSSTALRKTGWQPRHDDLSD